MKAHLRTGTLLAGGLPFLFLLILWAPQAWGARLSNAHLREMGVLDPARFWPIQLGADGLTLYAAEDLPANQRRGGVLSRIWILKFSSDGQVSSSRSLPLKMPARQQNVLTPDEQGMVILARDGTSFWYLDLESGALREFVKPGLGKTTWITEPHAIWVDQGRLYTVGYPLNKEGIRGKQTLALLDPAREGAQAITPTGLDIQSLYKHFKPVRNVRWINPELGFLGGLRDGKMEMTVWKAGSGFTTIGQYKAIVSMLGLGTHLVFAAKNLDGSSTLVVYDAATGRRWEAPKSQRVYDYPMLSADGEVVVASLTDDKSEYMDLYYGLASRDYQLAPLPGMSRVRKGVMRVAPNGRSLVFRNPDGLFWVEIPR
ncbi:MAG TPA: hypothetical protein VNO81_04105 [Candidatus Nitrosotenuis sp.]|nr:hypothetical protein [Candidatus Nitrosotenuis sp.]